MNISNCINSYSRKNVLKEADKVARAVRNSFDYICMSKTVPEASAKILSQPRIRNFVLQKEKILKAYRQDRLFIKNPVNFYKDILYCANREKLASCFEQSSIAEIILQLNGVKNCTKASLVSSSGTRMNHCVTCVIPEGTKKLKDIIVIDSWLQKAGYYNEMINLYKNNFARYFKKIPPTDNVKLEFHPKIKLSFDELKNLVDRYPQLKKVSIKKEPFLK